MMSLVTDKWRSVVDRANQTPRSLYASPQTVAELRRKLRYANMTVKRLHRRIHKLEEKLTASGEDRLFTCNANC